MLAFTHLSLLLWCTISRSLASSGRHRHENHLLVKAPSGTYRGLINGTAPQVRQFLGIRYAKPPVADLRWLPPQKLTSSSPQAIQDATHQPPSCPQYFSRLPSLNLVVPDYLPYGRISEDCLHLSIWTPSKPPKTPLPVILFLTGGAFQTGGVEINYQLPHHWVQRTQSHIVVTTNYRLNIFGFPNSAALSEQNLGILDQRAALEWVRDNIAAFDGDPDRITLWGESAGAVSVDYHIHAFQHEPIVKGFFAQSGTAMLPLRTSDLGHGTEQFSLVALHMNCGNLTNPTVELDCMRRVPWEDIVDFVGEWADSTPSSFPFTPVTDDKIVFSDYTARYASHPPRAIPAIFSNVEKEGLTFVPFSYGASEIDFALARQLGNAYFGCPTARTAGLRAAAGLETYRYLYTGNFSNVSPLSWMGAFHASDVPMMFGTHEDVTNGRGGSTAWEFEVSGEMQDFVLAFMEDAEHGLERVGWDEASGGTMLRFAGGDRIVERIAVEVVDAVCSS